jgi:hypothetical protein
MINLQTGLGRIVYFTLLALCLMVSFLCDLGFAFGSIGGAAACILVCTVPLLVGMAGIVSQSKLHPIAAMIGSGSMVAFIAFISVRDVVLSHGLPRTSIVREGWWWVYLCLNFTQLVLSASKLRQINRIRQEPAVAIR